MELIPTPDSIPVSSGWFDFFLMSTFIIHILMVNIMVGSSIIAFFNSLRPTSGSVEFEKDISEKLPFVISLAINFGVAALLFLQMLYGNFIYVSSQLMAVFWLSVVMLLITAYYSVYYYKFNFKRLNSSRSYFIGAAAVIFLCVAFFFSSNMTLMLKPSAWTAYFANPDGMILNLSDLSLLPRFLHFITASIAIAGVFSAIVGTLKKDRKENIAQGMNWFLYATLVQIGVGFWFQMSLPNNIIELFMGGSKTHTILFLSSLGLVMLTIFFAVYRKVWASGVSVLGLIFFMVMMRDMVRDAYLKPFFSVGELRVTSQYSPMIAFLIALLISIGIIVYVIRLAIKSESAA